MLSLDALKAACVELGLEYCEGETVWKWWGRWVQDYHAADAAYHHGIKPEEYGKADTAVIKVPGATWDIGLYHRAGQYQLVYDNYRGGHGIEAALGAGLPKLRQAYADQITRRQMNRLQQQGYRVHRQVTTDGRIQYTASKV